MGRNAIETVLGAVVIVIAALFMVFAYSSSEFQKVPGYKLSALFPRVDGLKAGGDVRINGVKVGSITSMDLVTESGNDQYLVRVVMSVMPDAQIPEDSIAMVASESLLGGKYLSLEIGVDEEQIPQDGTGVLNRTQSPMRLDDLIGQLIYSSKPSGAGQSQAAHP